MRTLSITFGCLLWLAGIASALGDAPLYESPPFDRITLDASNNHEVLKVKPLELPNRMQPPVPGKAVGVIAIELLDKPGKKYELNWRSIATLETFEQMVLAKARALVAEQKFDEAYDYFGFLQQNYKDLPGLRNAIEEQLSEEARCSHQKGRYGDALALLRELHARNPKWPDLSNAMGQTTDALIAVCVKEENYDAARTLVRNLAYNYPAHPVAIQWQNRFIRQAEPLLAEARRAAEDGRWHEAGARIRQVGLIWPELPGARNVAKTIHQKCSRVVVGVTTLADTAAVSRLDDWAARRTQRLLYRTLTEYAGSGTEGGRYDCPIGKIAYDLNRRRLSIRLKPNVGWAESNALLCNSDVSRRLLAMADPNAPDYRIEWADLLKAVSIRGVYDVDVELRRPHVRPEALMQVVLTPYTAPADAAAPPNGPFLAASHSRTETSFVANERYFAVKAGRPKELVERRYPSVAKAIAALKRGDILAIDRINPWNVASLADDPQLIVQSYALPLVHCLIPNVRRPLVSDRTFRRALLYGIHREAILEQMLGGVKIPGCVVTGSPFPLGISADDPLGYASDGISLKPRPYEPRLALAMIGTVLFSAEKKETAATGEPPKTDAAKPETDKKEAAKDEPPKPAPPRKKIHVKLVLAHPSDEIASAACMSIKKQLKLLDVEIELRPMAGPMPARVPDDVDLMYAELPMWEPLVDARRLLGEEGMSGGCSPYMRLALRQLDEAVNWRQARECLLRIHRIAYNDTTIVPLWQLVDHFAFRDTLRGVAEKPVSLYQSIEQWRPPLPYPKEP